MNVVLVGRPLTYLRYVFDGTLKNLGYLLYGLYAPSTLIKRWIHWLRSPVLISTFLCYFSTYFSNSGRSRTRLGSNPDNWLVITQRWFPWSNYSGYTSLNQAHTLHIHRVPHELWRIPRAHWPGPDEWLWKSSVLTFSTDLQFLLQ